ncbi:hypothetical protein ACTSKR_07050 [Chitinibacteraceae bacterium HSL-7]
MSFSKWFKRAVPTVAVAAASTASAGQTVATASWEFVAPEGWVVNLTTKPVQATGPNGELLQFSSYGIPASSQGAEAQGIRAKVEANALTAMQRAAAEAPLKITSALSSSSTSNGVPLHEIVSQSEDGKALFAQFAMLGPHAAVLITLDAQGGKQILPAIRAAIAAIKWAP